jgi:hypothetical protein
MVAQGATMDTRFMCEAFTYPTGEKDFELHHLEVANLVEVSGNFLIASIIESLGEAVALTRKYGLDPQTYVDFLTNSLFSAPVFKTCGGLIASGKLNQPASS